MSAHICRSWLWPDRTIGKGESRELRDEHNATVNELIQAAELLDHLLTRLEREGIDNDHMGQARVWFDRTNAPRRKEQAL